MPLLTDLDDATFQLPTAVTDPMYEIIGPVDPDAVTNGVTSGPGAFDTFMRGVMAHLQQEYEKGRITGADYTKAYIELAQSCLQMAVQFTLGKGQAFWASQNGQIAGISGRIDMETKRVGYATAKYSYDEILPQQKNLVAEQANTARAQTFDYRFSEGGLPGDPVYGLIGKQKDLYSEQITSFRKDAQTKAGKMFADSWTIQKTVDEGLSPPTSFTNSTIDTVLNAIRTANNLV